MKATEQAKSAAVGIVGVLRSAGHQAYFAGGCVRDLLLGRAPADYDVATSARPDEVQRLFEKTFAVGAQFGVVLVASPGVAGLGSGENPREILTEVATFRSDGAYSDGRRPDCVRFAETAKEDVLRRDFTINGMLLDAERLAQGESATQATLDWVGGMRDLDAGVIRSIGDARLRFMEDKLRMLRAVRFAARFGFAIAPETFLAMRELAPMIVQISHERVRDELTKMLTEGSAKQAFALLEESGLLEQVLPEVARMRGVAQPPQFHPEGDVWTHTLMLLAQLPEEVSSTLAWGALLHDVGKPATYREAPDRIRFDGHVEVGVRIAEDILRRLRFGNEESEQIEGLIRNHMRFSDVAKMKESTLKRFFRLPRFEEHLALHRMDCRSSHGSLESYDFAKERFETLPREQVRPTLLVTGRDLIAAGYRPGPQFKNLLAATEDAQLEGRIHTREEGLALVASLIATSTASSSDASGRFR